jgi:hypothetical protein
MNFGEAIKDQMKTYIGTKLVKMRPMNRAEYNAYRGWQLPEDEDGDDDGYLIENMDGGKPNVPGHDGYVSWLPSTQAYTQYRPTDGLSFGLAIEAMKMGKRVARSGWNGKGMFVYMVPANSYLAQSKAAKEYFGEDALVPYNAYLAIKNVEGTVSTWVPSVNDVLAEDWRIV